MLILKKSLLWSAPIIAISFITTGPTYALTANPISGALPVTIHARASCAGGFISFPGNQSHTTVNTVDRATTASCADGVLARGAPAAAAAIL